MGVWAIANSALNCILAECFLLGEQNWELLPALAPGTRWYTATAAYVDFLCPGRKGLSRGGTAEWCGSHTMSSSLTPARVLGKACGLWPGVLGQVGAWLPGACVESCCYLSFPPWHPAELYCSWGNWGLAQVLQEGRKATNVQLALKGRSKICVNGLKASPWQLLKKGGFFFRGDSP